MTINSILSQVVGLLLLVSIVSCKKDDPAIRTCDQSFYYYQNEKIYLWELTEKLTIGFTDTLTYQEVKDILNDYSALTTPIEENVRTHKKVAVVDINGDKSCKEMQDIIADLETNTNISYASHILAPADNQSSMIGIMDEFIVSLNDTNDLANLQYLADQTGSTIIKQNDFVPNVYILSADKTSDKKALDMANHFHETGLFEYAEPNFLFLQIWDSKK